MGLYGRFTVSRVPQALSLRLFCQRIHAVVEFLEALEDFAIEVAQAVFNILRVVQEATLSCRVFSPYFGLFLRCQVEEEDLFLRQRLVADCLGVAPKIKVET